MKHDKLSKKVKLIRIEGKWTAVSLVVMNGKVIKAPSLYGFMDGWMESRVMDYIHSHKLKWSIINYG